MSSSELLISIIIPVFNDAEYLPRSLDSCINQTYSNIEIIVVDDASTDRTPKIIASYAKKDNRIKSIRHDKNKKTLKAIKTGVLSAKGSYLMVVSGDDSFALNAVETCVNTIQKNPDVDIVHFGRVVYDTDGNEIRKMIPQPATLKNREILGELFSLSKGSQGSFSDKCWKMDLVAKVFRQVSPTKPLVLGEDQLVVFLCALLAKRYIAIPDTIHNYNFGLGMDGKTNIDFKYFIDYRVTMADSMDELEKQLKNMNVADWVWRYFTALKREHYAWSVWVTSQLSEKDRFAALKKWTERTSAKDTLIGVATTTPYFLDEYVNFLVAYRKADVNINMYELQDITRAHKNYYSIKMEEKDREITGLIEGNTLLKAELDSFLSIRRSTRLTVGNIRRRVRYGKNR